MSPWLEAAVVTGVIVGVVAAMLAWVALWFRLSDGRWWGMAIAFSPGVCAVYVLIAMSIAARA